MRLLEVMQKTIANTIAYNAEDSFDLFIQLIYFQSMMHQCDFMWVERGGGASLSLEKHCLSLSLETGDQCSAHLVIPEAPKSLSVQCSMEK